MISRTVIFDATLIVAVLAAATRLVIVPELRMRRDGDRFLSIVQGVEADRLRRRDDPDHISAVLSPSPSARVVDATGMPPGYGPLSVVLIHDAPWLEAHVPTNFCGYAAAIGLHCQAGIFRWKLRD